MNSPSLQSSRSHMHTNTSLPVYSVDNRGAVQKRTSSTRHRSISSSQAERLHHFAQQQSEQADDISFPSSNIGYHWLTPQPSPQPQVFPEPSIEPFPQWTVPTPPRSDSGVPTLSVDSNEVTVTSGISAADFSAFGQPTASAEMSSLGFLLPSQYGSNTIESEPSSYTMDQNYMPSMRASQPAASNGTHAYSQTVSSSPALYQSKTMPTVHNSSRRHSELPNSTHLDPSYQQTYRRPSNPYGSSINGEYSLAPSQTTSAISGLSQAHVPSNHIGSTSGPSGMPQYGGHATRSPNLYESNMYGQSFSTAPSVPQQYVSSQSLSYPPAFIGGSVNEVLAKPLGSDSSIRVLNQRPKPQCWEHGCNGRQFSTFSNLLRHQREKSGSASKSYCPKCGAEFTRTTARNGHLAHDKCTKQRRQSEGG